MITYTLTKTEADLKGIDALQKANLKINLSEQEIINDGFVTVNHDWETLKKLNSIESHVIAKDDEQIVGYVLAMTKQSKYDIPIIFPMFEEFDMIIYHGKLVSEYNYMVVGQVCVQKDYRGSGIFANCYDFYKKTFENRYDLCITEIAVTNQRSRTAHKKIGFKEIHIYKDSTQIQWVIVVWNWKSIKT
ncbi:MAG: GNAT family N-acetyltransferase [Gelidibacter sp.]